MVQRGDGRYALFCLDETGRILFGVGPGAAAITGAVAGLYPAPRAVRLDPPRRWARRDAQMRRRNPMDGAAPPIRCPYTGGRAAIGDVSDPTPVPIGPPRAIH